MKEILNSKDNNLVKDIVTSYETDKRMFSTNFKLDIESKNSILKLSFEAYSSTDTLKIDIDNKDSNIFGGPILMDAKTFSEKNVFVACLLSIL